MSEPNWVNQTIWTGDNLDIMRGMNSESVDLIYLDPPFNSKANYAAPIGSEAAGAEFKDTWGLNDINLAWHGLLIDEQPGLYRALQAVRDIHGDSMMSYLIYMAPRLMEMRRLLKPTGSIYLHCDPTASHYLKIMMDDIYGKACFQNEIVWKYGLGGSSPRRYSRKKDHIFFYTKHPTDYYFDKPKEPATSALMQGKMKGLSDTWTDIPSLNNQAKERTGYPTQKPLALLKRIIIASSKRDDMILDPFCGCATACIAAQDLVRDWVGIDISEKAAELVKQRMSKDLNMFDRSIHRTDIPKRTDQGKLPRYNSPENKKWLYGQQGGFCNACGHHFQQQNLSVDHLVPLSKGGTDHLSNLQLLCNNCNSIKGDRPYEWLLSRLLQKDYIKNRPKEEMSSMSA